MVTALAAALLSSGSALSGIEVAATNLPAIFVSACLDGEARLSPADATPISFKELPHTLRHLLRKPASSQIWRLNIPGRAYLYVLNYQPVRNTGPHVCGLASDAMNYGDAINLVKRRVMGDVYPEIGKSMQWIDPKGGYIASASTAGEFKILQTDLLSDAQSAALAKTYENVLP